MTIIDKRLFALGTLAAATSVVLLTQSEAEADVLSCPQRTGTVRVWDGERNACGSLSVNNRDWRNIGNPPWNDRIDDFGNDDHARGRAMCLYRDINYRGTRVRLPVSNRVFWANIVSSNRWTTASSCPTG